jgi:hypothetical protein
MKILLSILTIAFLTGCTTNQPTQERQYGWESDTLRDQINTNKIDKNKLDMVFIEVKNMCQMKSYQIQVPSPSCYSTPPQNCYGLSGFALGMCNGGNISNRPKCDYSSVNQANRNSFN